jgi:hypothetical protein
MVNSFLRKIKGAAMMKSHKLVGVNGKGVIHITGTFLAVSRNCS